MKTLLKLMATATVFTSLCNVSAHADPEQAYQGGKAMSDSITGNNTLKVDDRDAEQRARDWAKQKGREHGEKVFGKPSSGDNSKPKATPKTRASREF